MIDSAEEFRSLRESEHAAEYHRAAHDEAPLEVWLDILRRMPEMRFWVAQNKTIPVVVLQQLADDPDASVRGMVARKRKIPEALQRKLATDADNSVRSALAYNAKITPRVLAILAGDHDQLVSEAAKQRVESAD